ncbi:MAG: radical SAM protein [Deltaproteobacteria bacterium RIFCSPLOWO2_12_FULL_50_11]|nr:MAG: radical SAM protein [Deltaproteobacteria bacterium RIFCSPLOWO2_12_FULL_50_11]
MKPKRPYHDLYDSGELKHRVNLLNKKLTSCTLCPRHCRVNRLKGEEGFCLSGRNPRLTHAVAHFGEEPVLSGTRGSGTLFFASCNLRCVYCQNWQISHCGSRGRQYEITCEKLADHMITLQREGCHNINFVSPSHCVAQILEATFLAIGKGLDIPLVYNTNSYDDLETLKCLDGVIDIFLPDLKYADPVTGRQYSQALDYPMISRRAVREMFRQVGPLKTDEHEIATRGLIIRHLILPNDLAHTENTLRFIAQELSHDVTLSLMAQYYPTHKAKNIPLLSRCITAREYEKAVSLLEKLGLKEGWIQAHKGSPENYRPDFDREHPFIL